VKLAQRNRRHHRRRESACRYSSSHSRHTLPRPSLHRYLHECGNSLLGPLSKLRGIAVMEISNHEETEGKECITNDPPMKLTKLIPNYSQKNTI